MSQPSILSKGIQIINRIYFGYNVFVGEKPVSQITSAFQVRNALKYMTLDQRHRDIWDDSNMITAHKYQNIPQIDISTYEYDYPEQAINLIDDQTLQITYLYSSTNEVHIMCTDVDSDLFTRFAEISGLNKVVEYLEEYPDKEISSEIMLPIFGAEDRVNLLSGFDTMFNTNVYALYQEFQKRPSKLYVPFRRGWSRVLNVSPYDDTNHRHILMRTDSDRSSCVAHLLDSSTTTTWNGTSTRIENHGVEVEDLRVAKIEEYPSRHIVRVFRETHEYIEHAVLEEDANPHTQYFMIQTLRGINIDGIEFNMP